MTKSLREKNRRFLSMVDIELVGQLVDSMSDAVLQLEKVVANKETDKINKLRTFIFDLHNQIGKDIGEQNV